MADTARITQSVVEVLTLQPGVARITQSVVETLVGLGISCASLPHGMGGQFYTYTFPVGSGDPPYTFSITAGALPPGLSLDPATGTVSGTPTMSGTFTFTVLVTDSMMSTAACVAISIVINPLPLDLAGLLINFIGAKIYSGQW